MPHFTKAGARRTFVLLLGLLLLVGSTLLFLSCKRGDKIDPLPLTDGNGNPNFQIIYPDVCNRDIQTLAVNITGKFKEILGAEITIGTDWINRDGTADYPEKPTEILIGKTNRPETEAAMKELGNGQFLIRVVGQKVVIVGINDFCLIKGLNYFIDTYLSGKNAGRIPKNLNYLGECDYMYTFQIPKTATEKYDIAVTAATLQGLYNRDTKHPLYLYSDEVTTTKDMLNLMRSEGYWLADTDRVDLSSDLKALFDLAGDKIKTIILWDENVPATINVATTMAGVEDGIVMTPAQYDQFASDLPETANVISLVGRFTGEETGSKKNDAYRWAIREYLLTGKCSTAYICSFEDAAFARKNNNLRYAYARDLAVQQGAFVFDLSPWDDQLPKDDQTQKMGTDVETYYMILEALQSVRGTNKLTEIVGFFPSEKYSKSGNDETWECKYDGTQCEWKYAWMFTPYQCYWNPSAEWACNMSFHSRYEANTPLEQNRPEADLILNDSEDVIYMMLVMGDYDSVGSFYQKMTLNWKNSKRGEIPLAWSFNPNIIDHYPDIVEYFYNTATPNDYFVSNVGGAGWYNPSRVEDTEEQWEMWLAHHKKYFNLTDMSVSPDMWDLQTFSPMAEKYITQYATTGAGTLVSNQLGLGTGLKTTPHVAENGSVIDAISNRFDRNDPVKCAAEWKIDIDQRDVNREGHATFMSCRCVWITPEYLIKCLDELQKLYPDKEIIVVDPYNYYNLLGESLQNNK